MDIITTILQILQPYAPTIFLGVLLFTLFGLWRVAYRLTAIKANNKLQAEHDAYAAYNLAHLKLLAGMATDEEKTVALYHKVPKPTQEVVTRHTFKDFRASVANRYNNFIKKIDFREGVKRLNPFKIARELEESLATIEQMKIDQGNFKSTMSDFRWSMDDRIDRAIKKSKQPKKVIVKKVIVPPRNRAKFESHLNPDTKVGGSQFI